MEMRIASFEQQRLGAREVAPDFGALVALLASSQAAQPTARIAGWIESALEARLCGGGERVAALIGLFAPRRGERWPGCALEGCFNAAVPLSHAASTRGSPW